MKNFFIGGVLSVLCLNTVVAEDFSNRVSRTKIGFINIPAVIERTHTSVSEIAKTLHDQLDDPNLIILTDGVIYSSEAADLTQSFISNVIKKQIDEMPDIDGIFIGYVNVPQILEQMPEASKELDKVQHQIVKAIRSFANNKYDMVLTDGVIYAGKLTDVTNQVKQSIVYENKALGNEPPPPPAVTTSNTNNTTSNSVDLSKLEAACVNIGFKKGTESYGECVVDLKKRTEKAK